MEADLIRIAPDPEALVAEAAVHIVRAAREATDRSGRFSLALSGGTTPRRLYQQLVRAHRAEFPWRSTHFFWSDERWVRPDDARSNYRMARESLLDGGDVPLQNIHAVKTSLAEPEAAAADYQKEITGFFGGKPGDTPCFDLILLGLGEDGHTASLFPGCAALNDASRLVAIAAGPGGEPRITFTPRLINAAAGVLFLVTGGGKAQVLHSVVRGEGGYPACAVRPVRGELAWFVDAAAATLLK